MPKNFATANHPVWIHIAPEITRAELHNPDLMDPDFLMKLYNIRKAAGVPFRFISDARTAERGTAEHVGASKSAHDEEPCPAVDLEVHNAYERFAIVQAAIKNGISRIGVYPGKVVADKGNDVGSIHLDDSKINPSPRMWTRY